MGEGEVSGDMKGSFLLATELWVWREEEERPQGPAPPRALGRGCGRLDLGGTGGSGLCQKQFCFCASCRNDISWSHNVGVSECGIIIVANILFSIFCFEPWFHLVM